MTMVHCEYELDHRKHIAKLQLDVIAYCWGEYQKRFSEQDKQYLLGLFILKGITPRNYEERLVGFPYKILSVEQ